MQRDEKMLFLPAGDLESLGTPAFAINILDDEPEEKYWLTLEFLFWQLEQAGVPYGLANSS